MGGNWRTAKARQAAGEMSMPDNHLHPEAASRVYQQRAAFKIGQELEEGRRADELRRAKEKAAEREGERAEARERALDEALEPERLRAMRQWLVDHPGKSEAFFAEHIWPYMRPVAAEKHEAELLAATKRELLRSGRYSLLG